jgi:CRP/FNR family nitrogen fixation transcriptional regulator
MTAFTAASAAATRARVPTGLLALRVSASQARRVPAEDAITGIRRTFARGEEIFVEGAAADFFYRLVSGTVRICKLLSDGRRQIDVFHLAGDMFGLESGHEHRVTAEAVEDAVVIAFQRSRFTSLVHDDRAFGDQLMTSMISSLDRAHEHMVLLGRKTAQEKIATFLLDMAHRLAQGDSFDLPMTRGDIADHLGLTIETVSRTLTQMARDGFIALPPTGRTVALKNKAALQQFNV